MALCQSVPLGPRPRLPTPSILPGDQATRLFAIFVAQGLSSLTSPSFSISSGDKLTGIVSIATSQPEQTLVYEPLASGKIGLLRVLSCSDSQVQCELQQVELHSEGWQALSYVWGDAAPDRELLISGKMLPIRPNLLAALNALSELEKAHGTVLWIWVDAVCIDQNNLAERSVQVRLMDQIYGKARCVFVWLDLPRDDVQVVVEVLRWLQAREMIAKNEMQKEQGLSLPDVVVKWWLDELERTSNVLESQHEVTGRQLIAFESLVESFSRITLDSQENVVQKTLPGFLRLEMSNKEDLFPLEHSFWISFMIYMDNDWFRRVWTYQEVVLAKVASIMDINGGMMAYPIVLRCRDAIFNSRSNGVVWSRGIPIELDERDHRVSTVFTAFERYRYPVELHKPEALPKLLMQLGTRQAKLPKDYIYGVLGVVDEATRSRIHINYEASDAAVLVQAVKLALTQEGGAWFLPKLWERYERTTTGVSGLPSWYPDFSNAHNCPPLPDAGGDPIKLYLPLRSGLESFARIICEPGSTTIRIQGLRVDEVAKCVQRTLHTPWEELLRSRNRDVGGNPFLLTYGDTAREYLEAFWTCFPYDSEEPEEDVLSRFDNLHQGPSKHHAGLYPSQMQCLRTFCANVKHHSIKDMHEARQKMGISDDLESLIESDMIDFVMRQNGKHIFETVSGRIGFSFKPVSRGDQVVFLPGGETLHLLSPDGTRYVGSAYVEGFNGYAETSVFDALAQHPLNQPAENWEIFSIS